MLWLGHGIGLKVGAVARAWDRAKGWCFGSLCMSCLVVVPSLTSLLLALALVLTAYYFVVLTAWHISFAIHSGKQRKP